MNEESPHLQLVLRKHINWDIIRQQYEQIIKFANALRLGTTSTKAILKRFTRDAKHPIYQALCELEKAIKTIFYVIIYTLRKSVERLMKDLTPLKIETLLTTTSFTERIVKFSRRSRSVWMVTPIATKFSSLHEYVNGSENSLS
nr:transposase [Bacillus rhizoplanae]